MTPSNKFLKSKDVAVIGVPFNGGQPRTGVEDGPIRLVEFGLLNQLEEMGYSVDYEANENIQSLRPTEDPDVLNREWLHKPLRPLPTCMRTRSTAAK